MNKEPPKREYRARRVHKKSRNGCFQCKERKTKCDEATPRCSRCATRGLSCRYRQTSPDSASTTDLRLLSPMKPGNPRHRPQSPLVSSQSYMASGTEGLTSTSSPSSFQIPSPLLEYGGVVKLYASDHAHVVLDWTEVQLLRHYLTHTSRIIPFDMDELYALHVGIPHLAFHNKPLMSSILALAAVCKSHDLVEHPQQDREQMVDLLILADKHHRASLLQVQLDLPNACQYDHVLANTTLMVLYACASHCVRIRLVETQTMDEPLPREVLPRESQWISLIRAAHLAFDGLLNDHSNTAEIGYMNTENPPTITPPSINMQTAGIDETLVAEDGPSERTKDLLFPILAASSRPAFNALRTKARAIWKDEGDGASWTQPGGGYPMPDSYTSSMQACFASLEILDGIVTEVFLAKGSSPTNTSTPDQALSGLDSPPLGQLSNVSGWLRSYVARVTSSKSSTTARRPLRRVIMAFLNRVPAEYLGLVQTTLDSIGVQTGNAQQEPWESCDFELQNPSAQKLAMEIFAHWLVLVMLLDGVWWIGGIGAWELGRVVSFFRAQDSTTYTGENWWPESMYNIGKEIRNLTNMM